jgi:hypothetical protein
MYITAARWHVIPAGHGALAVGSQTTGKRLMLSDDRGQVVRPKLQTVRPPVVVGSKQQGPLTSADVQSAGPSHWLMKLRSPGPGPQVQPGPVASAVGQKQPVVVSHVKEAEPLLQLTSPATPTVPVQLPWKHLPTQPASLVHPVAPKRPLQVPPTQTYMALQVL